MIEKWKRGPTKSNFHVIFRVLEEQYAMPKVQAQIELGLDSEKLYLAFVGGLIQIKRPDRLIAIAAELTKDFPKVHLLVAGASGLFGSTKSATESQGLLMTFYGCSADDAPILSAPYIEVICSDNKGIPLTLIEAAQAGFPIVSKDVRSVRDTVVHQGSGILVECSSAKLQNGKRVLIKILDLRARFKRYR